MHRAAQERSGDGEEEEGPRSLKSAQFHHRKQNLASVPQFIKIFLSFMQSIRPNTPCIGNMGFSQLQVLFSLKH